MQKFSQISKELLFYLALGLLVFIPLYPKFPLFNVSGTFAAIRMEDLLISLTFGLWLIHQLIIDNIKSIVKDKLNQAILLFFFIGFVSTLSAVFLTSSVSPNLAILHYLRRLELMMLLPVFATIITTRNQLKTALVTLSGILFVVTIYALGQQYLHWPVISTTNSEFAKGQIIYLTPGARPNSTFAGHYDLAVYLTMAIVILSALFFYFRNILWKFLIFVLGVLSAGVLILTAARVSFIAAIFGVLVSLILTGKKIYIILLITVSIVALVYPSPLRDRFISSISVYLENGGQRYTSSTTRQEERSKLNIPTLQVYNPSPIAKSLEASFTATLSSDIVPGEPIDPTSLGVYRSFAIRFNIEWPRAVRAFEKNPLLGTGYSSLGLATDNDFLRSLGEVGLLGTIAFILIFIEIIKRLMVSFKSSDRFLKFLTAGVLSLMVAFILNGLFIDVFEASKIASLFWMILGINLAAGKLK